MFGGWLGHKCGHKCPLFLKGQDFSKGLALCALHPLTHLTGCSCGCLLGCCDQGLVMMDERWGDGGGYVK